jgi:hypothetical protein
LHLEDQWGFFWELDMQAWALSNSLITQFFNQIYIWGNFPLIGLVALWMYFCYKPRYVLFRNAFLISGAIALIIFVLLTTAPPRYLWWVGFKDTVMIMADGYYAMQPEGFVNRYAAVPSMHFGWILLLGIGIVSTTRFRPMQALGLAMPILMFLSVVVTGNHFILDALVGGIVSLIGLAFAAVLHRWGHSLRQAFVTKISFQSSNTAS